MWQGATGQKLRYCSVGRGSTGNQKGIPSRFPKFYTYFMFRLVFNDMNSVWRPVEPNMVNSLVRKHHAMKVYGTVEGKLQSFLISIRH
jgi:hypothetical protein